MKYFTFNHSMEWKYKLSKQQNGLDIVLPVHLIPLGANLVPQQYNRHRHHLHKQTEQGMIQSVEGE